MNINYSENNNTLKSSHVDLSYLLLFLISFSPVYISSYAFSDDWFLVQAIYHNINTDILAWDIHSGRPIYGLLKVAIIEFISYFSDLKYVRFLSILTIWALCCFIYRMFNSRRILLSVITGKYERALFPFMLCLLPSFQVYASWAICSPFVISVMLSMFSYCCLIKSHESISSPRAIFSIFLLIASFSIYQPSAMSFLFFVFIDNCLRGRDFEFKKLSLSAIVISIGMLVSLFLAKSLPNFIYSESIKRTELATDLFVKLIWFITHPLRLSITNYDISSNIIYIVCSTIIVIIGLLIIFKSYGFNKVWLTLLLAVVAYTPNMAVNENWSAFRTLVAISLIMSSVFLIGVFSILKKLKVNLFAYFSIGTIAILSASYNMLSGFTIPQSIELTLLSDEIVRLVPKNFAGELVFDISNAKNRAFSSLNHTGGYDEFGQTSMIIESSLPGMIDTIKDNQGMSYKYGGVITDSQSRECKEQCIYINISEMTHRTKTL